MTNTVLLQVRLLRKVRARGLCVYAVYCLRVPDLFIGNLRVREATTTELFWARGGAGRGYTLPGRGTSSPPTGSVQNVCETLRAPLYETPLLGAEHLCEFGAPLTFFTLP